MVKSMSRESAWSSTTRTRPRQGGVSRRGVGLRRGARALFDWGGLERGTTVQNIDASRVPPSNSRESWVRSPEVRQTFPRTTSRFPPAWCSGGAGGPWKRHGARLEEPPRTTERPPKRQAMCHRTGFRETHTWTTAGPVRYLISNVRVSPERSGRACSDRTLEPILAGVVDVAFDRALTVARKPRGRVK